MSKGESTLQDFKQGIPRLVASFLEDILSNKPNAVENYKKFLSAGRTKTPLETLKIAGVDLSKPDVVESAIKMFSELIQDFKELNKE